jgi:hypothetical protein
MQRTQRPHDANRRWELLGDQSRDNNPYFFS